MVIFFLWVFLSSIVGVGANLRGRNDVGWFLLAIVLSPLLVGPLVLALPRLIVPSDGGPIPLSLEAEYEQRRQSNWIWGTSLSAIFLICVAGWIVLSPR
jgi:hypothetical protein